MKDLRCGPTITYLYTVLQGSHQVSVPVIAIARGIDFPHTMLSLFAYLYMSPFSYFSSYNAPKES